MENINMKYFFKIRKTLRTGDMRDLAPPGFL